MPFQPNRPAKTGGFNKDEREGHLLLFLNTRKEEGPTQFGDATWAVCDIVDLDSSQIVLDAAVFGTVLAPSIYGAGPVVLGRLVRGRAARAGQSPPWLLEDPSDADIDRAQEFGDRYVNELPSGRMTIDEQAFLSDLEED